MIWLRSMKRWINWPQTFPRQAQVVELLFFGGLTTAEVAEVLRARGLDISQRTVERDWRFARARLLQQVKNDDN